MVAGLAGCNSGSNKPLWPGAHFTERDRTAALERGLAFIYKTALDAKNFDSFGSDYLWCFYEIAATSADPHFAGQARTMGRERAQVWRRTHAHAAPDLSADDLSDLLFGAYAAEQLGFSDERLKDEIRAAAAHFAPRDFLHFDPASGPRAEGSELQDLLTDALIESYTADHYGVTLGAPFAKVVAWLPLAKPYREGKGGVIPLVNLVTHVVYTANDYNRSEVRPGMLAEEFGFLKANALDADIFGDSEMLGEFMDTLRALGMTSHDEIIQRGFTALLERQNADGSWGTMNVRDIYNRYHPTWTAIDGLREYRWRK